MVPVDVTVVDSVEDRVDVTVVDGLVREQL